MDLRSQNPRNCIINLYPQTGRTSLGTAQATENQSNITILVVNRMEKKNSVSHSNGSLTICSFQVEGISFSGVLECVSAAFAREEKVQEREDL